MKKLIENSRYSVDTEGNVYGPKGNKLCFMTNHKGYLSCKVTYDDIQKTKTCTAHRLVAKAFIPNPENKPQVNHIDGDKTNNNVSNLEWVTNAENQRHSTEVLGNFRGEKCHTAILKEHQVLEIMQMLRDGKRNLDIAAAFNVGSHMIKQIRRGKAWTYLTKGEVFQTGIGMSDQQYLLIKQKRLEGLSIKAIMELTELCKSSVCKVTGGKYKRPHLDSLLEDSTTIETTSE